MRGIYTAASNRMVPFLESFYKSLKKNSPGWDLYVIPFSDDVDLVEDFCSRNNVNLIEPDCFWDEEIGKRIYGNEEYRPGILSRDYYRKLNIFSGPLDEFIFADVNSLILGDLSEIWNVFSASDYEISFMARSVKGRTLRHEGFSSFLNKISPKIQFGYSAAFIISRKNLISKSESLTLARNKNIRNVFGKAPEQGFINWAISVLGIRHSTVNQLDQSFQSGFWKDKYSVTFREDGCFFNEGPVNGQKVYVLKWTGQDFPSDKPGKNDHLFGLF